MMWWRAIDNFTDVCLLEQRLGTHEVETSMARGGLLRDSSTGGHGQRVAGLIAISGSGRVLNQPNVVRKHIARHSARRVLVARVLVVHPERHARADRNVGERDLVAIRRNGL